MCLRLGAPRVPASSHSQGTQQGSRQGRGLARLSKDPVPPFVSHLLLFRNQSECCSLASGPCMPGSPEETVSGHFLWATETSSTPAPFLRLDCPALREVTTPKMTGGETEAGRALAVANPLYYLGASRLLPQLSENKAPGALWLPKPNKEPSSPFQASQCPFLL